MTWYEPWRDFFKAQPEGADLEIAFAVLSELVDRNIDRLMRLPGFWRSANAWSVWADSGWAATPDADAEVVRFSTEPSFPQDAGSPEAEEDPVEPTGRWAVYEQWNEAVRLVFFNGNWAGRPVYLDIDDQALARIAESAGHKGDQRQGLAEAISATLHLESGGKGVFEDHLRRLGSWRQRKAKAGRQGLDPSVDPPPFLALLAAFARAAEEMHGGEGFAPNNYMGRLWGLVGDDSPHRDRLERHFRDHGAKLWEALNEWLETHNGVFGLPTARVWDWRVHVGIPISQVLMKETDRQQLPAFFHTRHLSPGRTIPPADMARLLADWLPNAPVSPYLKALWKGGKGDRDRVAELVSLELENWDGTIEDPGGVVISSGFLWFWANLRHHPLPTLRLGIIAVAGIEVPEGTYELSDHAAEPARHALGDQETIIIGPPIPEVGSPATNTNDLSMPDVLLALIDVRHPRGFALARKPRPVVVLVKDDAMGGYIERERVELDADTLVLAHNTRRDDVDKLLEKHARPGFQSEPITGTPDNWTLYTDVQITSISAVKDPGLACLVPLSHSSVSYGRGLKLPGPRAWHRDALPEARLTALDDDEGAVKIDCSQLLDPNLTPPDTLDVGIIRGQGTIQLSELALADGDYRIDIRRVTATTRSKVRIASDRLKVRSGSWPKIIDNTDKLAGYPIDTHGLIDPVGAAGEASDMTASGATIPTGSLPAITEAVPPAAITFGTGGSIEDDNGPPPPSAPRGPVATCAIDGGHYWVLPDAVPWAHPKWFEGECKNCGLTKAFPANPPKARHLRPTRPPTAIIIEPQPIHSATPIDHNLLLDGLTYAGAGRFASLQSMTDQISDEPWAAIETARLLTSLGHIDLQVDRRDLRPQRWAITRTTLAILADGSAIVCGGRSKRLQGLIEDTCALNGSSLIIDLQPGAPDRWSISNADPDQLVAIAVIAADHGIDMEITERPDLGYANTLPTLPEAATRLPTAPFPFGVPTKRYDPHTNQWADHAGLLTHGAYRFLTRPVTYRVLAPGAGPEAAIVTDNRWSKWVAAALLGWDLLAYDPSTKALTCPLGAQLPGLYERATVLASGWAPQPLDNGTVVYRDIPAGIAALLWGKIRPT